MVSMWSTRLDSKSPHSCGHFDTEIEVVTIKKILELNFFQRHEPKCAPVGGDSFDTP